MSNGFYDTTFTPPENSALPIRLATFGQSVAHSGGVSVHMQKRCFKCGNVKPLSDFYTHPQMGDGHLNKCKECTKFDVTKHRASNLDKVHAYDNQRAKCPDRLAAKMEYQRRYREENPEKYAARTVVGNAIRDGILSRQPCEKCGEIKTDAHHTDYSKPLDVTWLCVKCHHAEHRKYDYDKILTE